jgi:hypothetical protein
LALALVKSEQRGNNNNNPTGKKIFQSNPIIGQKRAFQLWHQTEIKNIGL